jgi:hypothetical protein
MAFPRDRVWPWIVAAILSALIFVAMIVLWPAPAQSAPRSHQHWGGSDFSISCATVREWRGAVSRMSPARRAELARKFNITRKQRRQAYACLKGK